MILVYLSDLGPVPVILSYEYKVTYGKHGVGICPKLLSGKSYKHSTKVIYDSRIRM